MQQAKSRQPAGHAIKHLEPTPLHSPSPLSPEDVTTRPGSDLPPSPRLCDDPALIFSLHTHSQDPANNSPRCPLPPAAKWQEGKERGIKHGLFGTKQRQLPAASSERARQILHCVAKDDPGKLMRWLNTILLAALRGKLKSKPRSHCFVLSSRALRPFPMDQARNSNTAMVS